MSDKRKLIAFFHHHTNRVFMFLSQINLKRSAPNDLPSSSKFFPFIYDMND